MSLTEINRLREALSSRPQNAPLEMRRQGFEAMMAQLPLAQGVTASVVNEGRVTGIWLDPPGGRTSQAIMHLHGGAFVLGSAASYKPFCSQLAKAAQVSVFALDYRLAPEHPFPAALEDAIGAIEWLHSNGFGPNSLGVSGDSAGANLALAALQQQAAPAAAACYFLSPYLDLTHTGASIALRGPKDPFVVPSTMAQTKATYCGAADATDPRISPLFGPMTSLPPTLIQVGSDETLFDDAKRLEQKLLAIGKDVVFQEWVGMVHVWPLFAHQLEEGVWAIAQAGSFFARTLQR